MSPLFKLLACAALGVQLFLGCFGQGGGTLCLGAGRCSEPVRALGAGECCCGCCDRGENAPGATLGAQVPDPCECCIRVPALPGGAGLAGSRTTLGDEVRAFFAVALSAPAA